MDRLRLGFMVIDICNGATFITIRSGGVNLISFLFLPLGDILGFPLSRSHSRWLKTGRLLKIPSFGGVARSDGGFGTFLRQERRFVPLGKGDAAFFAAGGAARTLRPPVVPLRKGDKKSPSRG